MATFDLGQSAQNYIDTADDRLLKMIKELVETYHDDAERISVEQYNKELESSEAQIERGEFYAQEQVRQTIEEWKESSLVPRSIGAVDRCQKNDTQCPPIKYKLSLF
ncbi:MAG: hypothetical protein ACFCUL_09910 [Flavobacteriaceae bacterium]